VGKGGKKEEEKEAAMKRWEEGNLSQEEGETYSATARPIRDLAADADAIEEVATGQRVAHMAGMRALGSQWEEDWAHGHAASPQQQRQQQQQPRLPEWEQQQRPQQQQQQQQQHQQKQASPRVPQQRQQQGSWAQSAVVAASAAAFVNITLSKVAQAHVRTEALRISVQGRLSTTARFGASAAMLLCLWQKVEKETGRGRERWKAHELFTEGGQCSQAILDFLSSTDVGKTVPPVAKDGDGGSEVLEGELRERAELEDEKRTEELGAADETGAGEGTPLFLPTPPFMASVE